jgi:hypothetical protein
MGAIKNFSSKLGIAGELFQFLWQNKRWWLIPVIVVLFVIGFVLIFSQSTALGPFIYTLF